MSRSRRWGVQIAFELAVMFSVGTTPDAEARAAVRDRVARIGAAMQPWRAERDYLNFREPPDGASRFFAPEVLARLQAVKRAYDPVNLSEPTTRSPRRPPDERDDRSWARATATGHRAPGSLCTQGDHPASVRRAVCVQPGENVPDRAGPRKVGTDGYPTFSISRISPDRSLARYEDSSRFTTGANT